MPLSSDVSSSRCVSTSPLSRRKLISGETKSPLSIAEAETLASSFDFSGGQIDNIVRKTLMKEVVEGVQPTLCNLQALCREEKISKNSSKRVGFNN